MATARRAMDEAVRSVLELRAAPERGRDAAEERAWEALRRALREARTQPLALAAFPSDEAAAALRFLAAWAAKRRVLRAKVVECLRVLLADEAWLRAARGEAELLAALEALLPVPASAPPPRAAAAACPAPEPPEDSALQLELRGAQELLATGLQGLRGCGWAFPPESAQNALRDGAVDAFRSLFLGVARLSTAARRAGVSAVDRCRITAALEAHAADWPGVLRFLASLHRVRRVFSSQISSLLAKLSELSPSFEEALESAEGELPGAAPAPSAALEGAGAADTSAARAPAAPAAPAKAQLSAEALAERAVFVGSRVEALYEGGWYGGTVVAVPAEDEAGRWIVQCDVDPPGTLTYAQSVSSRVEALYEGEWYRGSVVSVPSEDPEGRWAVQCDSDPPGTVTYTTSVRLAPAAEEAGASGQDVAAEVPVSADGAARSMMGTSVAAELAGAEAEAAAAEASPPVSQPSVVSVEGAPLSPAPAVPEVRGARISLGAFARLPGGATPPRSLTPPPASPAPRTPSSPSPSLRCPVEVVEVVPRGSGASATAPAASPRGSVQVAVEVLPSARRSGAGAASPASPAAPCGAAPPRGATPPRTQGSSVRVPVAVVSPKPGTEAQQRFQPQPRTLAVPVAVRLPSASG